MKTLNKEIGTLLPNKVIHFITDGSWSLHELLDYLLNQTGSASVKIASFALSEVAVRCFARLIDEQKITALDCLFDKSCRRTKFDLLTFCSSMANIRLTENHMKLIIIKNEDWHIVVNTSANFTPNKRAEAGIITTILEDYNQYNSNYDALFSKAVIYE